MASGPSNLTLSPERLARLAVDLTSKKPAIPAENSGPIPSPALTAFLMPASGSYEPRPPAHEHLQLPPYQYQPLPTPSSIRLLKLGAIDENGLLHCTLKTIDLYDDLLHPFHCLSYTWGNPYADGNYFQESFDLRNEAYNAQIWPIVCDGKLLCVHKNLYDALHQLPRSAWIQRLNRRDEEGQTFVHQVAKAGGPSGTSSNAQMIMRALAQLDHTDIFRALHAAGADMVVSDKSGRTPLHLAAEQGHAQPVKSLIELGVDPEKLDNSGQTARDLAVANSHEDVIKVLQECVGPGGTKKLAASEARSLSDPPDDWIWIDAICINQPDIDERQHQVRIMEEIYSSAVYLKVWLGEEDKLTETAVNLVKKIATAPGNIQSSEIVPYQPNDDNKYLAAGLPIVSYNEWLALGGLYRRQWFRRAWVFQETVTSNDILMFCGQQEIPYQDFVKLSEDLIFRQYDHGVPCSTFLTPPQDPAYHLELNLIQMARYSTLRMQALMGLPDAKKYFKLSNLLAVTRTLSATLPNDKIFAVLGLMSRVNTPNMRWPADYKMKVEQLYAFVSRQILAEDKNLLIFSDCIDASGRSNRLPDLPSWTPDYSITVSTPLPDVHRACGDLKSQPSSVLLKKSGDPEPFPFGDASWFSLQLISIIYHYGGQDPRLADLLAAASRTLVATPWNVLRIQAAEFDKITHVGYERSLQADSSVRLDTSWFDLAEQLDAEYHPIPGVTQRQTRSEAFWRTLCINWSPLHGVSPSGDDAETLGAQFRNFVCAVICGEAQYRAVRYGGRREMSEVLLEALLALSMNISNHVVSQRSSDGSIHGPYFREIEETGLLDKLDRLVASEAELPGVHGRSYFPTSEEVKQFGESGGTARMFDERGLVLQHEVFEQPFFLAFSQVYRRRRLYVTEKKYIGLGPASLSPGDSVWIVPGYNMPVVLRPVEGPPNLNEESVGRYQFVGQTYLHGIMQGEAIEGLTGKFGPVELV